MLPFREKKILKITGFWVGRIVKGLPKVSESLLYRQCLSGEIQSISTKLPKMGQDSLFGGGFCPHTPYLN